MTPDLAKSADLVVFTTRDYAGMNEISIETASRQLKRQGSTGRSLVSVTRGVWANTAHPYFSPLACVPVLLGAEHGYVSFLSALHLHGAISQIPGSIQVATTGHTRKLNTPVGLFEFLQLKPEMFRHGVQWSETPRPYRIAKVEKALLDVFYIATRRKRRFARLPELSLRDAGFSVRRYRELMRELKVPTPVATAMGKRSEAVFNSGA